MKFKKALLMAAVVGTLAGCSNVKQTMGVGRHSPDEFTVVKRAPLTLPPEYTLRPPGEAAAPTASQPLHQARTVLLGERVSPEAEVGGGEVVLLQKAGAQEANPEVRRLIDRENGIIAIENRTVAERLIFWKDSEPKLPTPSIVDAPAETERLRQNAQQGLPANAGDVPVIERKKSTIDKIF